MNNPPVRNRSKSKWGWQFEKTQFKILKILTDDVLDYWAALFGINDEQSRNEFEQDLTFAVDQFWAVRDDQGSPKVSEIAATLSTTQRTLRDLLPKLMELDDRTAMWLKNEFAINMTTSHPDISDRLKTPPPEQGVSDWYPEDQIYDEMVTSLEVLDISLSRLSDLVSKNRTDGKTKKNGPLYALINTLADTFESHIGTDVAKSPSYDPVTGLYGGNFFEFVLAVLNQIDPDSKYTNNALGTAIPRALGVRK